MGLLDDTLCPSQSLESVKAAGAKCELKLPRLSLKTLLRSLTCSAVADAEYGIIVLAIL